MLEINHRHSPESTYVYISQSIWSKNKFSQKYFKYLKYIKKLVSSQLSNHFKVFLKFTIYKTIKFHKFTKKKKLNWAFK